MIVTVPRFPGGRGTSTSFQQSRVFTHLFLFTLLVLCHPPSLSCRIGSPSRTFSPERSHKVSTSSLSSSTQQSRAMAAPLSNISACSSATMLLPATESPLNLSAVTQAGPDSAQSLAPLCSVCCCGFLNRLLAVVFMVSLTFAIVVGNVVTLTVFVQTRQSRTPQGYLKGKRIPVSPLGSIPDSIRLD